MRIAGGELCPLLRKACVQGRCKFWVHLRGKDPQSSRELDEYDCAVKWLPILLIEGAQATHQTGAAIESLRNEVVRREDTAAAGPSIEAVQAIKQLGTAKNG